jgi:Soluble lytic murein transglycosylase and related regulatory proteins (some contain LysM/invasin domains)
MTNPVRRTLCSSRRAWTRTALSLLLVLGLPQGKAQDLMSEPLLTQRQLYKEALVALARNDRALFEEQRGRLRDYVLRPYLDYNELSKRLSDLPEADVHDFLAANSGSVLALRLQRQWLEALVEAGRWEQLIADFDPAAATTELRCQVLFARVRNGDQSALDEVRPLWDVARSQPKVCDPLFDAWRAAGKLTPDVAWSRFSKAINAGQNSLANYITRSMPAREQHLATLWLETLQQPQRLRETSNYSGQDPELLEILPHTLRRLAQRDAELAWELVETYANLHDFPANTLLDLRRYVVQRLQLQGHVARAESLLRADPSLPSDTLVEWLLRDALKQQDWQRVDSWLPLLSTEAAASERWRYWRARSMLQQGNMLTNAEAHELLATVAETRSFYGFLAADLLAREYSLVDRPAPIGDADIAAALGHPALRRAFELYLVDDETNALREWQQALSTLNEREVMAAGKIADQLGWHRNGIQALIHVSYWDDLAIRFPLAYRDQVGSAASRQGLDSTFVYAIARQESAFITNARSSAGALGLMQLMPATARETARAIGLNLNSNQDILEPSVNIALGSRYLAKMIQDFGGNRILAAAAYNAGPGRVRQWLAQTGRQQPFDIWIETIPFAETRNYVQNVLAFSVIYGYRMGQSVSMLTEEEMKTLL